jgi:hypothetical protein
MFAKTLHRHATGLRAVLVLTSFCMGVAACGSSPTVGDQILAQGKGTAAIGTKWNQGNEMVTEGQNLSAKGRQQIKDGQDNIRKGDSMVIRGKASMAEAETQYKAAQARPQTVVIPKSSR